MIESTDWSMKNKRFMSLIDKDGSKPRIMFHHDSNNSFFECCSQTNEVNNIDDTWDDSQLLLQPFNLLLLMIWFCRCIFMQRTFKQLEIYFIDWQRLRKLRLLVKLQAVVSLVANLLITELIEWAAHEIRVHRSVAPPHCSSFPKRIH